MSWQDVMHHYQDGPEDPTPPAFKRESQHAARKPHRCESCEGSILPGERYEKSVWLDDDGLHVVKTHADRDACAAMQKAVEQARQDAEAAHWEAQAHMQESAEATRGLLERYAPRTDCD